MKSIPFVKMHGAGNDFVFMTPEMIRVPMNAALAKRLLDRHFGVGGDQLLFLKKSAKPFPYELDIYNSDGSKAEMCGNGVRAVAYYLNRFQNQTSDFLLKTKAGPIRIGYQGQRIKVDMGEPILEGRKIPIKVDGPVANYPIRIQGKTYFFNGVSMGNPHAVIFVKNVDSFPVTEVGPLIERSPLFPNRVNVEFVEVISKDRVKARVWERGAGETLACGTGACAIGVASARAGKTGRQVKIDLPGGRLVVDWGSNNHVYLSGPAEVSYRGEFLLK